MKILVTGIGVVGKSSFRRQLVHKLRRQEEAVVQIDIDAFSELRDWADQDCLEKPPAVFLSNTIYIIEDVNAPTNQAVKPLKDYDFIYYIQPDIVSHAIFWICRMTSWIRNGKYSWDPKTGWKGTRKPKDLENIIPIIKVFLNDFKSRRKWIQDDLEKIAPFPHKIIWSYWWGGMKFR